MELESANNDMDVNEQHNRFRQLMSKQVRYRLKNLARITRSDWVIRAYFSLDEFHQEFPDRQKCEEYLDGVECRLDARSATNAAIKELDVDWSFKER